MNADAGALWEFYRIERVSRDLPRFRIEREPHLTCYVPLETGLDGLVCFARIEPDALERAVTDEISRFRTLGIDFEWKVYDFDQPPNLRSVVNRTFKLAFGH